MKLVSRRVVLAILLAACVSACAENEYVAPPPPAVTVARPTVQDITDYLAYTGRAQAVAAVQVQARVKGFLQSMHYVPGTFVKKGDLLFVIDPKPFEVTVAARKADLSSRRAEAALAKTSFERSRELYRRKATSEIEFLRFQAERDKADAAVLAAEADLADAELDLDYAYVKSPISGRAGRHRVDLGNLVGAGEATLLTEVVDYSPLFVYFQISELDVLRVQRLMRARRAEQAAAGDATRASDDSPDDGAVGESTAEADRDEAAATDREGDRLEADEDTGDRDEVVGEPAYLRTARPDAPRVEVGLADESGYPHVGYLDFSDSSIDPATGTLELRGILENKGDIQNVILPGSFARIRVPVGTFEGALLVPDLAVGTDQGGRFVLVVGEGDVVEQRVVEVGGVYDGLRHVVSGVAADDRVVVNGLQRARPGARVTPREAADGTPSATPPEATEGAPVATPGAAAPGGTAPDAE